jgi:hypothetical protein
MRVSCSTDARARRPCEPSRNLAEAALASRARVP